MYGGYFQLIQSFWWTRIEILDLLVCYFMFIVRLMSVNVVISKHLWKKSSTRQLIRVDYYHFSFILNEKRKKKKPCFFQCSFNKIHLLSFYITIQICLCFGWGSIKKKKHPLERNTPFFIIYGKFKNCSLVLKIFVYQFKKISQAISSVDLWEKIHDFSNKECFEKYCTVLQ